MPEFSGSDADHAALLRANSGNSGAGKSSASVRAPLRSSSSRANECPGASGSSSPPKFHTRIPGACYGGVRQFSARCRQHGIEEFTRVEPMHVAAWAQESGRVRSRPTVKQHLAAVRMLFDWMILGQLLPVNPAAWSVGRNTPSKNGARRQCCRAKKWGSFLQSIPTDSVLGLRDRALLGVMAYTFARIWSGSLINTSGGLRA